MAESSLPAISVPETRLGRPTLPRTERRRLALPRGAGGRAGVLLLVLTLLFVIAGPMLIDADPSKQSLRDRYSPPVLAGGSWAHPLGTDQLGRDLLARIAAGGRTSIAIGVLATAAAGLVGVALGLVAGYRGGRADRYVSFLADVQLALPFVVVAIGVVAVLGASTRNVIIVLAITGWVAYARVVRLQAASLRSAAFVEAAYASGATQSRIVVRHVLPNLIGPSIVLASQQVAAMMLYEAALSYLGLGVPRDTITWGGLVADGRESLLTAWWVSTLPGVAIAVTILGLNLTGDWLQEQVAPRGGRR